MKGGVEEGGGGGGKVKNDDDVGIKDDVVRDMILFEEYIRGLNLFD